MRTRPLIVIFCASAFIVGVAVYYQSALRNLIRTNAQQERSRQQAVQSLQNEIARLNGVAEELKKAQRLADQAMESQRSGALSLQEELASAAQENKELNAQLQQRGQKASALIDEAGRQAEKAASLEREKTALIADLERLRQNFEMVHSVRLRLGEIEKSLGDLGLKPGKEELIRLQLDQLLAQLEKTNEYLQMVRDSKPGLAAALPAGEKKEPGAVAATAVAAAARKASKLSVDEELKIRDELSLLKNQFDLLSKDNAVLKEKYRLAEEMLARTKNDSTQRDEKIFELQKKLIEAENNLSAARERYAAMEKDAAGLREKYVASELEKENLRVKLLQTTSELDDLRKKFVALLGRISGLFNTIDDKTAGNSRIGVELIPQQKGTE